VSHYILIHIIAVSCSPSMPWYCWLSSTKHMRPVFHNLQTFPMKDLD